VSTVPVAEPETPKPSSRTRIRVVGALVVVVVASGGIAAYHWRTHPDAFGRYGVSMFTPVPVGQELHVGMTSLGPGVEPRTVTLHDARPRIVQNTSGAKVSFSLCRESGPLGADTAPLDEYCAEVVPLDDSEMEVSPDTGDLVVMTIRPTQPGSVRIRGMDLTYTDGWQRGTEHAGPVVRVRTR